MEIKAVLDRVENAIAVLLVGEEERPVNWPAACLPAKVKEGDILTFSIEIDPVATRNARAEAEDMLRRLIEKNS